MKQLRLLLFVVFAFGSGVYVGHLFQFDSEPTSPVTPRWIHNQPPDPEMFDIAINGFVKYSKNRSTITDFAVHSNPTTGLIETGWYRDHKGEAILKAQILVWDKNYRVDVWQRLQLTGEIVKTEWCRMSEKDIHNTIEELIMSPNNSLQPTPRTARRG